MEPSTSAKRSYRLREPIAATDEHRVKVGLYLLPSLYGQIKVAAVRNNTSVYREVEEALQAHLRVLEGESKVVPHG